MPVWNNADGLTIRTGREEAQSGIAGTYVDYATGNMVLDINLDLTTLTTTSTILDEFIKYPKNWILEQVDIFTEVAPTGGGTFTLGFANPDRSALAATGILNAVANAAVSPQGKKVRISVGDTGAGTAVGTSNTVAGTYITGRASAAYTAGVVKVRLHFHPSRPPVI